MKASEPAWSPNLLSSPQLTVLAITVGVYPFVNMIPQAAFIGMVWMIVCYMFEWSTFSMVYNAFTGMRRREDKNMFTKIKRMDVVVIVVVTIVTVLTNLAVAVACGLLVRSPSPDVALRECVNEWLSTHPKCQFLHILDARYGVRRRIYVDSVHIPLYIRHVPIYFMRWF